MKTLNIKNTQDVTNTVSDVETYGNCDLFQLISKASSEKQGWMKSTKAMDTGNGVIVQVTTQQYNHVAEALTFVPNCKLDKDENGNLYITQHVY